MRDPPPPDSEVTLPGVHSQQDALWFKRENARLRRERDEARAQLTNASVVPFKPPRSLALAVGKYAGLLALAALAARSLVKKLWPQYTDIVDGILSGIGL